MLLAIIWRRRGPSISRLSPSLGEFAGEIHDDAAGEIMAAVVYVGI